MIIASLVALATPPRVPLVGDGLTKAAGKLLRVDMRVLSPRMAPPDDLEEGSIANTATLWPWLTISQPRASMRLDLPAPGGPEIPILKESPNGGVDVKERRRLLLLLLLLFRNRVSVLNKEAAWSWC